MEAIALILTKFSDELLAAQVALLSFALCLAVYWTLIRKKKRESAEWVPAALVRAYLDRMRADEHETRRQLFGEGSSLPVSGSTVAAAAAGAVASSTNVITTVVQDPALLKEVEALRAQLASADQRAMEFDRMMNGTRAEKAALEQKLKDAASATPGAAAASGEPSPVQQKEIDDLKAKLQEYEVIEDDLANLKKYQKENEVLKQKVEQLEKPGSAAGGPPTAAEPQAATTVGGASASAEPATVISGTPAESESATTIVSGGATAAPAETKVASTATAATEAAVVAAAPAAEPAAETNTNVLQPIQPDALADKSVKQKEEELLSEFEKMLAS